MLAVASAASAALLLWAGAASAGTYPMYQCHDPVGQAAPVSSQWAIQSLPGGRFYNSCSGQGTFGIQQTPGGQTGNEGGSALALNVPSSQPNTSITRGVFALFISPKTGNGYSHGNVRLYSAGQQVDEQLLPAWDTGWIDRASGPFTGPGSNRGPMGSDLPSGARDLALMTNCFSSCTFAPAESVEIRQATLILREDSAPAVGGFAGTVLTGTPRAGRQTFRYDAGDAGSGVRAVTALVDDEPAVRDDLGDACRYVDFNACPTSVQGRTVAFDVGRFGQGEHRLSVVAEDAAGNSRIEDVARFIVGATATAGVRGAVNGSNASDRARLTARIGRRASAIVGYGRRVIIRGRLVNDAGAAIQGARIDVLRQTIVRGATMRAIGRVRTGSDGTWRTSVIARMPSSRLRFVYRSHEGDAVVAAQAGAAVRVRPRLALEVLGHIVPAFGVIRLRGRITGAPLPRRGKVIELRARSKGTRRWVTFRTVRSDRHGRYRADYRLRKGYRNITYEFQALSRVESGYPYETGRSAVRRVRVR